jgi:hypothetical protein
MGILSPTVPAGVMKVTVDSIAPPKKGVAVADENYFLNPYAPVTQTVDFTAVGTGDYTLTVHGSGTVTSADVGATGTGHGAASDGSPITFNLSAAGTVSFTVAGGPTYVQVVKI